MIRVLIIDDHPLVREQMTQALEALPDFRVIGAFASVEEAAPFCASQRPEVVLLSLDAPGLNGGQAVARLLQAHPRLAILLLIPQDADEGLLEALRAGAEGCLFKDASIEEIETAVRTLAMGDGYLDPQIAVRVLVAMQQTGCSAPPLSERDETD